MEKALNITPRVSVLMPVYNAEKFLSETIRSVLNQSLQDFEFIIVDDASQDSSASIIHGFEDPRIRYFRNEKNLGITATLNKGLSFCRAACVARMDADDLMHPDRLLLQVETLDNDRGIAVLATRIEFIDEDGDTCGEWKSDRDALSESDIRALMAGTNCIAHPSVMMRAEVVKNFLYRESQKGAEDWDLWLRLLNAGYRIAKLPQVLLQYRLHAGSIMAGSKKQVVLEKRLLRSRSKFLLHELSAMRLRGFLLLVVYAQLRTFARHLLHNVLKPFLKSCYRLFTYNPLRVWREFREVKRALDTWNGRRLFVFNYLHEGGAEQVHADILKAVDDPNSMLLVTGFSRNKNFLPRFAQSTQVVEAAYALHHPFTAGKLRSLLAAKLNSCESAIFFGSNTEVYFEIIPHLSEAVRCVYLIHAFHFQVNGNLLHRKWLDYFYKIHSYVFVSGESKNEFAKLCRSRGIPQRHLSKLQFISNGVKLLNEPLIHERPSVLFVARKSEEKRVELYYRIADICRKEMPHVRFTVLGFHDQHPGVDFLGALQDPEAISRVYASHDILVLTSIREGFPMVIMEAMAHGLVVAATPVGDIRPRLHDAPAFVTASSEANQVVEEISAFILQSLRNKEELDRQRKRSYEFASRNFSMQAFTDAYRSLLS